MLLLKATAVRPSISGLSQHPCTPCTGTAYAMFNLKIICQSDFTIMMFTFYRGKLEDAIAQFREQLKYARTSVDCQNAFNLIESINAQLHMRDKFGMSVPNLYNIMSGGMPMM